MLGGYETKFECAGVTRTASTNRSEQTKLFVKLTRYRPWMIWAKSDGMLQYEIPNFRHGLFLDMKSVGGYLYIHRLDSAKQPQGQFSMISNSLMLNLDNDTHFSGACRPTI